MTFYPERDPNQVISTQRAARKPRRTTNLSQGLFLKHRSCERPCEELLPWLKWITGGNPTSTVLRNLLEKTERERLGLATGATLTSPFSSIVHRNISVETSTRFLSHGRDLLYPHRNLANFFPSSQRFLWTNSNLNPSAGFEPATYQLAAGALSVELRGKIVLYEMKFHLILDPKSSLGWQTLERLHFVQNKFVNFEPRDFTTRYL